MCLANESGMFLSLKDEVAHSDQALLSMKDYVTFLEAIKRYVPYSIASPSNQSSAVCNLM
jgi:hypothetical protein